MLLDETILFTTNEAARADLATEQFGIPVATLMEQAGYAVAAAALRHFPQALRFVVLCGPGNNGGDGYVTARVLRETGCNVEVFNYQTPKGGPARAALASCPVAPSGLAEYRSCTGDVIIDALFGAGLKRDLPAEVCDLIKAVTDAGTPVLAVDLPSGVCGDQGRIRGASFRASVTVTFEARKPGHVLLPGRSLCGAIEIADIGMPKRIVRQHAQTVAINNPRRWLNHYPAISLDSHKYRRGHLAVFSGGKSHTGAARMTAGAGLRAGAGLVTVAVPADALDVCAPGLTAAMIRVVDSQAAVEKWLTDAKIHSCVIGPGFGVGETLRQYVETVARKPCVIDADAITSFAQAPERLFGAFLNNETPYILTPHEGEFARLFPDIAANETLGKLERAKQAAARSGAIVIYKGADTVIAAPDGRCLINENAPAWLATAGSGDVLAGIAGANLAQGMPAFEAAASAVWLHAEVAQSMGAGMTAEELIHHIPQAVRSLNQM